MPPIPPRPPQKAKVRTFQSALDVTPSTEHIKAMVVGDSGTGKSVFAASFPTPGLVFDLDKGILTYRGKDWAYSQYNTTSEGWREFLTDFNAICKLGKENPENFPYKTVVLDSCSTLTDMAMEQAMLLDPKRSVTGGPLWNVHYQMVSHLTKNILTRVKDLPCNVVVIAHLKFDRDDNGVITRVAPLLTGQLDIHVPKLFDEVYYSAIKGRNINGKVKTEYFLNVAPRGHYHARSRISGVQGVLPNEIPNNYGDLMEATEEGLKNAK